MFGRIRNGNYPHEITFSPQTEKEAACLMEADGRDLSNLIAKCIHEKYNRIPKPDREEWEAKRGKEPC